MLVTLNQQFNSSSPRRLPVSMRDRQRGLPPRFTPLPTAVGGSAAATLRRAFSVVAVLLKGRDHRVTSGRRVESSLGIASARARSFRAPHLLALDAVVASTQDVLERRRRA